MSAIYDLLWDINTLLRNISRYRNEIDFNEIDEMQNKVEEKMDELEAEEDSKCNGACRRTVDG